VPTPLKTEDLLRLRPVQSVGLLRHPENLENLAALPAHPVLLAYLPPAAVLLSHIKPATSNQPAVLFSQNKPAPATSQPNSLKVGALGEDPPMCFPWLTTGKLMFVVPSKLYSVSLFVAFALRMIRRMAKTIPLPCVIGKRTANIYVPRVFIYSARQSIFLKIDFCTSFNSSTSRTLFCTLYFKFINVSINLLF
jgi:hypothetical protein